MPLSPATIASLHRLQGWPSGTSTCGFILFMSEPHGSPNHRIGYQGWSTEPVYKPYFRSLFSSSSESVKAWSEARPRRPVAIAARVRAISGLPARSALQAALRAMSWV